MARRLQRSKEPQDNTAAGLPEEDPDIAGIRPGPQPPPEDEPL